MRSWKLGGTRQIGFVVTGMLIAASMWLFYQEEIGNYASSLREGTSKMYAAYEENKQLEKLMAQSQIQAIKSRQTEADFNELSRAKEAAKQLPPQYAYSISRIISSTGTMLEIDLGSLDGIKKDDPVLSLDQFLVGMVSGTTAHTATVALVNTKDYMGDKGIAVRSKGKSDTFGIAEYDSGTGGLAIKKIPPNSTVAKGDVIETLGGNSSNYVPGLKLGNVADIEVSSIGLSSEASMKIPQFPASNDVFAFVVKSKP